MKFHMVRIIFLPISSLSEVNLVKKKGDNLEDCINVSLINN
jgi:hypothetical protein